MAYSTQRLTTVADCDTLLTLVRDERDDMVFELTKLEKLIGDFSESSVEIDAELQAVRAELTAYRTLVDSLPEGSAKKTNIRRIKRLEAREVAISQRSETKGVVALLEKELEMERLKKEIAEIDAFIGAIEARKAQL